MFFSIFTRFGFAMVSSAGCKRVQVRDQIEVRPASPTHGHELPAALGLPDRRPALIPEIGRSLRCGEVGGLDPPPTLVAPISRRHYPVPPGVVTRKRLRPLTTRHAPLRHSRTPKRRACSWTQGQPQGPTAVKNVPCGWRFALMWARSSG